VLKDYKQPSYMNTFGIIQHAVMRIQKVSVGKNLVTMKIILLHCNKVCYTLVMSTRSASNPTDKKACHFVNSKIQTWLP